MQWVIFRDLPFKTVSYLQFQTSARSCVLLVSTSADRSPERPPPPSNDTRAPTIKRTDLIPLLPLLCLYAVVNELLVMNQDFI